MLRFTQSLAEVIDNDSKRYEAGFDKVHLNTEKWQLLELFKRLSIKCVKLLNSKKSITISLSPTEGFLILKYKDYISPDLYTYNGFVINSISQVIWKYLLTEL